MPPHFPLPLPPPPNDVPDQVYNTQSVTGNYIPTPDGRVAGSTDGKAYVSLETERSGAERA